MGIARFSVHEELIRERMKMPSHARILSIEVESRNIDNPDEAETFVFEVFDEDIPEGTHDTTPIVLKTKYTWDWNIQEKTDS